MDETIKAGDIAYVFRGCIHCGNIDDLGEVIKVIEIGDAMTGYVDCCKTWDDSVSVYYGDTTFRKYVWCLKKIPPLEDLEGIRSQEQKPVEIT